MCQEEQQESWRRRRRRVCEGEGQLVSHLPDKALETYTYLDIVDFLYYTSFRSRARSRRECL